MKVISLILSFLLVCLVFTKIHGQIIFLSMHSKWDDRLDQWEIITLDEAAEEEVITIEPRWVTRSNLQEWRITTPDHFGDIKTKWRNDFTRWQMTIGGSIIDISQKWRNDPNVWEIRSDGRRITVETYQRNDANVWEVRMADGTFFFFTEYRNDPRDWIIESEGEITLTTQEKIAALFIGLFQSIPKV